MVFYILSLSLSTCFYYYFIIIFRVEDVMMKSFAELDSVKHHGDHAHQLKEVESIISSLDNVICGLCTGDIEQYYKSCQRLLGLRKTVQVNLMFIHVHVLYLSLSLSVSLSSQGLLVSNIQFNKSLSPGRFLIVQTNEYHYISALLLQQCKDQSYTSLVLCNHGNDPPISLVDPKSRVVTPYKPIGQLWASDRSSAHTLIKVKGHDIVAVCKKTLTLEGQRILKDCENRQIPRFK